MRKGAIMLFLLLGIALVESRAVAQQPKERATFFSKQQVGLFRPNSVAFSPDGQSLVLGCWNGGIKRWDVFTGKEEVTLFGQNPSEVGQKDLAWPVAFRADGQVWASAGPLGSIGLRDSTTGKALITLRGRNPRSLSAVAFSPDNRMLAAANGDAVTLWELQTGKERASFKGNQGVGHTYCVAFASDGKTLATGNKDKSIKLWDLLYSKARITLNAHPSSVTQIAFSPNGKLLASGGEDGAVILWDFSTGQLLLKTKGQRGRVHSLVFSPDGKTLASGGGDDGEVMLWDVATGKERITLKAQIGAVLCLAFSPDGKMLAMLSDGTVKLWDIPLAVPAINEIGQRMHLWPSLLDFQAH